MGQTNAHTRWQISSLPQVVEQNTTMNGNSSAATLSIDSGICEKGIQTQPIGADNGRTNREEHFCLNLSRMTGRTDAVTPETMLEFCLYLQHENVAELQFLEQDYTAELFNDTDLDMVIDSVDVCICFHFS